MKYQVLFLLNKWILLHLNILGKLDDYAFLILKSYVLNLTKKLMYYFFFVIIKSVLFKKN